MRLSDREISDCVRGALTGWYYQDFIAAGICIIEGIRPAIFPLGHRLFRVARRKKEAKKKKKKTSKRNRAKENEQRINGKQW